MSEVPLYGLPYQLENFPEMNIFGAGDGTYGGLVRKFGEEETGRILTNLKMIFVRLRTQNLKPESRNP